MLILGLEGLNAITSFQNEIWLPQKWLECANTPKDLSSNLKNQSDLHVSSPNHAIMLGASSF